MTSLAGHTGSLKNNSLNRPYNILQSTLSKTDTVVAGSNCPSKRGVHLIEVFSYNKMFEKQQGWDQHQVYILMRCPSYIKVPVKRELTVFSSMPQYGIMGRGVNLTAESESVVALEKPDLVHTCSFLLQQ